MRSRCAVGSVVELFSKRFRCALQAFPMHFEGFFDALPERLKAFQNVSFADWIRFLCVLDVRLEAFWNSFRKCFDVYLMSL